VLQHTVFIPSTESSLYGEVIQEVGGFNDPTAGTCMHREVADNSVAFSSSVQMEVVSFTGVTGENTPGGAFMCDSGLQDIRDFMASGSGVAPSHIAYGTKLILQQCDAVGSWTDDSSDATTPTANTTNYKEGTGSIDLGKDGTASTTFKYNITLASAVDTSDVTEFLAFLNIRSGTDLNKLATSSAVTFKFGSDSSNYKSLDFDRAELAVGWKTYKIDVSSMSSTGSPDMANMDFIEITMETTNATDTITHGDLIMDYYRGTWDQDPTATTMLDEQFRQAIDTASRSIGDNVVTYSVNIAQATGNTYTYRQLGLWNDATSGDLYMLDDTPPLKKDSNRTIDSSIRLEVGSQ